MKQLGLITLLTLIATGATSQIRCVVKGRVVNRPESTSMMLSKPYEDDKCGGVIPIKDSTFEFVIDGEHPEIYMLRFQDEIDLGVTRPIHFCTTNDTIAIELHPADEYTKNTLVGGEENWKMLKSQLYDIACFDSLFTPISMQIEAIQEDGKFYTEAGTTIYDSMLVATQAERKALHHKLNSLGVSGELYTPQATKRIKQADSAMLICQSLVDQHRLANLSLYDYSQVICNLSNFTLFAEYQYKDEASALDYLESRCAIYAKRYRRHPYNRMSQEMIRNLRQVAVGRHCRDLKAPDLDGRRWSRRSDRRPISK